MASRELLAELDRAARAASDDSRQMLELYNRTWKVATRIVACMCEPDELLADLAGAPLETVLAAATRLREVLAARLPELQRELANLETAIGELERAAPS